MRVSSILCSLAILLAPVACEKKGEGTENPDEVGSNLLGPTKRTESIESITNSDDDADLSASEDDGDDPAELDAEIAEAEKLAKAKKKGPNLPPKASPAEVHRQGKKKTCKEVDPKPEVSASYGVYTMMGQGQFKWGQSPDDVFKLRHRRDREGIRGPPGQGQGRHLAGPEPPLAPRSDQRSQAEPRQVREELEPSLGRLADPVRVRGRRERGDDLVQERRRPAQVLLLQGWRAVEDHVRLSDR
ncbi:MAG: hypothetical protein IPN32_25490 [Deltaproteobacteria bacterium]|nr:hypothetical protein [Deltaproteobacteria bacterium]